MSELEIQLSDLLTRRYPSTVEALLLSLLRVATVFVLHAPVASLNFDFSDEVQASSSSRIDEERARHAIACASLEQAAAELEARQAQIEGEIIQQQSSHRQRVAIISAPFDSLAASKAEIEQQQQQLQQAAYDAEARARAAFDSLPLLRLKIEETGHHKLHLVNEIAALLDSRAKMIQTLDELFVRERTIDGDIAQVQFWIRQMMRGVTQFSFQAKVDAANRSIRLRVMQLKDDVAQMQSSVQVQPLPPFLRVLTTMLTVYDDHYEIMIRAPRKKHVKSPQRERLPASFGATKLFRSLATKVIFSCTLLCLGSCRAFRSGVRLFMMFSIRLPRIKWTSLTSARRRLRLCLSCSRMLTMKLLLAGLSLLCCDEAAVLSSASPFHS